MMNFIGIWFQDTGKRVIFLYRNNTANLIDDYIQYGQSAQKNFFQVVNTKEQVELETKGELASIYFRFDPQYDIYERRIYSFGELLGQIGGLFQIILMVGIVIVSIFSDRLFVSSIIKKIYQIDETRENIIKSIVKTKQMKHKKKSFDKIDIEKIINDEKSKIPVNESILDLIDNV